MSKVRTIDTHTHVLTEETAALLRKEAPKVPVTITPIDAVSATLDVGGVAYRPFPRGGFDIAHRLRDMDEAGVDVHVLSVTPQTYLYNQEAALGAATAAIQNARLHENTHRLAVLEERERIGMDLHDGVIQSIYGVGLALDNARALLREDPDSAETNLKKAMEDLNRTIRDIRNYILDLRPRQLRGESLIEGLNRLVSEFRQNTRVEISLAGPKDHLVDLPQINAMALFHICQESLANIAKHANAKKVTIDLWTTSDRALLEVHDDGNGFDLEKASKTVGHGLANMQTRANNVGGDVDIISAPGEGTTILAWVPRSPDAKTA